MTSLRFTVVSGVVSIVLAAGFGGAAGPARAARPVPEFDNFPVEQIWHGKVAPTVLRSEQDHRFAARLRELSGKKPNFAGHYALSSWGCGAACTMAVAVDVKTGDTVWLPFTVCCWDVDVREPVAYRHDSKLVIVRGSRDETGNGIYYYLFDQHRFTLLRGEEQPVKKSGN
ncbi:hypothetical protein [Burkholderia plantarii]|uniref:hypothetical protein n=1 Tax=Burkholderia plantarii TaxID=41899 RepID=UPI0018DB0031|nr:hypothetical protein [Burkholderia plantarii]MBI0330055.1 hypothetical protein [Burkholderia plantarii]